MPGLELFFKSLVAHAAADFVLQSEAMSRGKNRYNEFHDQMSNNFPKWYY